MAGALPRLLGLACGLVLVGSATLPARSVGVRAIPGLRGTVAASTNAVRSGTAAAPPSRLDAGNLLANPGFEGAFAPFGANELVVPEGWAPWYDGALRRPEFKDEAYARYRDDGGVAGFSIRVFHGKKVAKFFTSSGTHDAGLHQTVAATPGSRLRFTVWVQSWSSDCDDPCVSPLGPCREGSSNSHGTYRVSAGIDPTGAEPDGLGASPPATVVWSEPLVYEAYAHWFRLEVEATALADHVTVYTRGNPQWPVKHNDSYWDDARLEVVGVPGEFRPRAWLPSALQPVADTRLTTDLAPPEAGPAERRRDAWALGTANDALLDPAPPGTNLAIEYPVRAFPDQENFNLPTCSDLEFESVLLHNVGAVAVPLGGWTLSDEEDNVYTFPPVVIPPDGYTRIWTKSGPDTALGPFVDLYWNRAEGVWNGPGASAPWDVATVRDDAGAVIAQRGYP